MAANTLLTAFESKVLLENFCSILEINVPDLSELIVVVDDWWFVPRTTQGYVSRDKRMQTVLPQFCDTGRLPAYFAEALRFAKSDMWKRIADEKKKLDIVRSGILWLLESKSIKNKIAA